MNKERHFERKYTVELRLRVDCEFYILVGDANVDQMVQKVPLKSLFISSDKPVFNYLQKRIKRRLNLKPVVNEILNKISLT